MNNNLLNIKTIRKKLKHNIKLTIDEIWLITGGVDEFKKEFDIK